MKTIVGLFESDENVQSSINELKEAGLKEDKINILICNEAVRERLGIDQSRMVAKYAGWGAILGIAVAGSFGLVLGLSALPIHNFGPTFTVGILIAFTGIGVALGGLLGTLMGVDAMEKVDHLCDEGMRFGGELEVVQATDEFAPRATGILQQTKALAVEIYPEIEEGV